MLFDEAISRGRAIAHTGRGYSSGRVKGRSAFAKAMADESVFRTSTRREGSRNMYFCETNRIGNRWNLCVTGLL